MISCRNRIYLSFVFDTDSHKKIIEWKKKSRVEIKKLPDKFYIDFIEIINCYFQDFHFLTVPAPTFHDYEKNYPIWEIAKNISKDTGIELKKFFPDNSGKKGMHVFSGCTKKVQEIKCPAGKFILILDDLYTTGHTARVSAEAIIKCGSFPVVLVMA